MALACCLHGGSARGCPDTPAVVAPDDDLNVGECARVDAHDVRALPGGRTRGSSSSGIITAVRHDDGDNEGWEEEEGGEMGDGDTQYERISPR